MVYRVSLSVSGLNLSPRTAMPGFPGFRQPLPVPHARSNPTHFPAYLASRARECSGSGENGNQSGLTVADLWVVCFWGNSIVSELNLSPNTVCPDHQGFANQSHRAPTTPGFTPATSSTIQHWQAGHGSARALAQTAISPCLRKPVRGIWFIG